MKKRIDIELFALKSLIRKKKQTFSFIRNSSEKHSSKPIFNKRFARRDVTSVNVKNYVDLSGLSTHRPKNGLTLFAILQLYKFCLKMINGKKFPTKINLPSP